MEKYFQLSKNGTNVRTEIIAGITTFFTMAYILFANPDILSAAGMDKTGVFVATAIAAIIGTLVMALVANVPYATAPGMGLNAFFAYVVCGSFGFTWQEALAMVFICGIINVIITVTKIRKSIIQAIPKSLQLAIGGGIGFFIAYIGVKNAGFLNFAATQDGFSTGAGVVPELSKFADSGAQLALIGLVIVIILMLLKAKGAMLIGIVLTTLIGIPMGVTQIPSAGDLFNLSAVGSINNVAFSFFGSPGFGSLFADPSKIFIVLLTIFAFSLSDTFDTIGTFIGTGRKSGIFDDMDEKALKEGTGFKSKMDKALFADSTATSIGALVGTSNTTTYIESAAGIGVGGRTGLTALVVAALFLLCIPFASLFGIVPSQATAPILIIVGVLMMESIADIKWSDFEEALPAFLTILIMAFGYNISYGIAAGFISYCIVELCKGRTKKLHPILIISSLLFVLNFIVLAITSNSSAG